MAVIEDVDGRLTSLPDTPQGRLISIGLSALSSRSLVWTAALFAGAVWGFTVYEPSILRLIGSAGYCVSVLVPIILWYKTGG